MIPLFYHVSMRLEQWHGILDACIRVQPHKILIYARCHPVNFLANKKQRTVNENAAGVRRICNRSSQPKIEIQSKYRARLILRRTFNATTT